MKRCPECRRDYFDDTLVFCLDDGATLLEGPSVVESKTAIFGASSTSESPTAILTNLPGEAPTAEMEAPPIPASKSAKRIWIVAALVAVLSIGGFFGYKYLIPTKQIESIAVMP